MRYSSMRSLLRRDCHSLGLEWKSFITYDKQDENRYDKYFNISRYSKVLSYLLFQKYT